jgi:hypothetical protein
MIAVTTRNVENYKARWLIAPDRIESTSMEDCSLLYLLIRQLDRRAVLDIGTNIGTTAVCMQEAVRRNGGALTTCDPIDYDGIPSWSPIRFIKGSASLALFMLKAEGHHLDFCFFDWPPDQLTCALLREVATDDAVFAVHDYSPIDKKGRQIFDALVGADLCHDKHWFFPDLSPEPMPDGCTVNMCTAFCIPTALLAGLALGT